MRVFLLIFLSEILLLRLTSATTLKVQEQNMRVRISAFGDTIIFKFIRPSEDSKLDGYILGYGSSMFSKQLIQLPEDGQPYETERDAEPKYLIAVQSLNADKPKKQCTGEVNLEKPLHIVIGSVTQSSVLLSWGTLLTTPFMDSSVDDCIDEGQFTVRYREKEPKNTWNYQNCPTTSTVIDNLKPDALYEFEVRADTETSSGVWSPPVIYNTADEIIDEPKELNQAKPEKPVLAGQPSFFPAVSVLKNNTQAKPASLLRHTVPPEPQKTSVFSTEAERVTTSSIIPEDLPTSTQTPAFPHAPIILPMPKTTSTVQPTSQPSTTKPNLLTDQQHISITPEQPLTTYQQSSTTHQHSFTQQQTSTFQLHSTTHPQTSTTQQPSTTQDHTPTTQVSTENQQYTTNQQLITAQQQFSETTSNPIPTQTNPPPTNPPLPQTQQHTTSQVLTSTFLEYPSPSKQQEIITQDNHRTGEIQPSTKLHRLRTTLRSRGTSKHQTTDAYHLHTTTSFYQSSTITFSEQQSNTKSQPETDTYLFTNGHSLPNISLTPPTTLASRQNGLVSQLADDVSKQPIYSTKPFISKEYSTHPRHTTKEPPPTESEPEATSHPIQPTTTFLYRPSTTTQHSSTAKQQSSAFKYHPNTTINGKYHPNTTITAKYHPNTTITTKYHPNTTITGKYHPNTTITAKYHPNTTITGKYHPNTTITTKYHPNTTITGKYHPNTTITAKYHPDTTITGKYHPNTTITAKYHPNTTITAKYHPNTTITGKYHPSTTITAKYHPNTTITANYYSNTTRTATYYPNITQTAKNYPTTTTQVAIPDPKEQLPGTAKNLKLKPTKSKSFSKSDVIQDSSVAEKITVRKDHPSGQAVPSQSKDEQQVSQSTKTNKVANRNQGRGIFRNSSSVSHPLAKNVTQRLRPNGRISPILPSNALMHRNATLNRKRVPSGERHIGLLGPKPQKEPKKNHVKTKTNQVSESKDKEKVIDLKQMDPVPLKPLAPPATEKTANQEPTPTTLQSVFNGSRFDTGDNSSVFSPHPISDIDAMGRKRFVAPHVIYKTDKRPQEPCSVTHSLSFFPDEEVGNLNVTGPPKTPPSNLTVLTVEGCPSFVILDWEKTDNETTEYEVESTTKGPHGKEVSIVTTNQTHTAVENLKPESSYEFKVTPKNELGSGPASDPVTFSTESADPRVSEMPTGKNAIWSSFPFKADSYSECNGRQYIKRTWYRKFVGIQLCNSLRYKIYLSDSLKGKFYSIGDQAGYGEDHCQFVDSFLDGRTGGPLAPDQLPPRQGFFRSVRQEPVKFGEIGGNSLINYVAWYECGIPIPGKW